MLGLTATTGKIGGATLDAILKYKLIHPNEITIFTSSSPDDDKNFEKFKKVKSLGIKIIQANYKNPIEFQKALQTANIDKLFLVSTPNIEMDFNDSSIGKGREKDHFNIIDASIQSGKIKHIYYTSLAFKNNSRAGVMRAHFRTEEYLKNLQNQGRLDYTIIRMGLYNESWPLYLGHYNLKEKDQRSEIVIAGDGQISWTSVSDLGIGTAIVLAESNGTYTNKTFYLSLSQTYNLKQVCEMVDSSKSIKIVSMEEYVDYYTNKLGMDKAMLEWWCTTYPSLSDGLCHINDPTLEDLLATNDKTPDTLQSTIDSMLSSQ